MCHYTDSQCTFVRYFTAAFLLMVINLWSFSINIHNNFGFDFDSNNSPRNTSSDARNALSECDCTDKQHKKEQQALDNFRKIRPTRLHLFWNSNYSFTQARENPFPVNAEEIIGGPILDFLISGFPKCGTTGMMRTLSAVATMPSNQDVCTQIKQAAYYSHTTWPLKYGGIRPFEYSSEKPLKGSKCPYWVESVKDMKEIGTIMPKTNLIIGIRHPFLWFQSFANQMWTNMGQRKKNSSVEFLLPKMLRPGADDSYVCHNKMKLCSARGRFYLPLARLGKTALQKDERGLLAEELYQARRRRNEPSDKLRNFPLPDNPASNIGIPNQIFLFDSTQGKEEYLYEQLAEFVRIDRNRLPSLEGNYHSRWSRDSSNSTHPSKKAGDFALDLCLPEFDFIRKELLPISYTLGRWLLDFFVPASVERDDITIPNLTAFREIVQTYLKDPCDNGMVRNEINGEYDRPFLFKQVQEQVDKTE